MEKGIEIEKALNIIDYLLAQDYIEDSTDEMFRIGYEAAIRDIKFMIHGE